MDEKERQARREGRGQYLAREEQKTIKRIPLWTPTAIKERGAELPPSSKQER